jgi:4-hydroxybenzoate polyprenyltransferase
VRTPGGLEPADRASELPGPTLRWTSHAAAGLVSRAASSVAQIIVSMRPQQWTKNLFVLAALIFSQKAFTPALGPALVAFAIFCGLSGAIYLLNDVADRNHDRVHPKKRERPIASGRLSSRLGLAAAIVLIVVSLGAGLALSVGFVLVALMYVVQSAAYSAGLKRVVILDVMLVAAGFVLRTVAGALAIQVDISGWLLVCTTLIALFLAVGKRRHEYFTLEQAATSHRPVLNDYSPALLDQMIAVVTASTVTAYALYTMSPETTTRLNTQWLPATLPFVLYGIFRYLYLLYCRRTGGNPAELLVSDLPLLVNTALWLVTVLVIIYGPGVR